MRIPLSLLLAALLAAPVSGQEPAPAQEPPAPAQAPAPERPSDPALARYAAALERDPHNVFYQYAVARTSQRLGLEPPQFAAPGAEGRWRPQLYEMTTGALAVQETLQLDRLAGAGDVTSEPTVRLADIEGVAAPSIPFAKLLEGRTPVVEPLASAAPADWYYVHAPRVSSLRRVLDAAERWGAHLLAAYAVSGREPRVREKLERQLLLRTSPELDQVYDLVAGEAIVVGSDPFLAEGSDVTVVLELRSPELFRAHLDRQRREAVGATSGRLSVLHERYRAWTVDGVASADRSISCYVTVLGNRAIVSNSYEALRRVADVVDGLAPSMASADEFRYMRSVKPYAATGEDAFLFLSDAFVRRVTGPRLKIGEARRVRCAVTLRTIGFAEMMHRTEHGSGAASVEDLAARGYLDMATTRCPDGGRYALEGGVADCSIHNRVRLLTPNVEVPLDRVAPEEAEAYARFKENYALYWRRFVDPVGIRASAGQRLEVDATVLPLVENSIYSELRSLVGPEPVDLSRPQAANAVATLDMKAPLSPAGAGSLLDDVLGVDAGLLSRAFGDRVSIQVADGAGAVVPGVAGVFGGGGGGGGFDDWLLLGPLLSVLVLPVGVVVPVRDRAALDEALARSRATINRRWRGDAFFSVEGYRVVQGGARQVETISLRLLTLQLRLFHTVAGDRFVLANDRDLLERLAEGPEVGAERAAARLEIAPSRWERLRPALALGYAEDARRACLENVSWLEALAAAYGQAPHELVDEALAVVGVAFACPAGGRYVAAGGGLVECALHGSPDAPRQGPAPVPGSPAAYLLESVRRIEATFSFTDDGISTRVVVE